MLAAGLLSIAACGTDAPDTDEAGAETGHSENASEGVGATVHWSYEESNGPEKWGTLAAEFALCDAGLEQSPIDLNGAVLVDEPSVIVPDYQPAKLQIAHHEHVLDILDNGHTIQVTYDEGSTLQADGQSYELVQYHFHAPSEHTIASRRYPMEIHLVHSNAEGQLAVVGALISEGTHNPAYDPVWSQLPGQPGESRHLEGVDVDINQLLPGPGTPYFRYDGSLTTPPCSEGVSWFVFETPVELSLEQIAAFTSIIDDNNRPVQPLYDRELKLMPPN